MGLLPQPPFDPVRVRAARPTSTREPPVPSLPATLAANSLRLHSRLRWCEPAPAFRAPLRSCSARHRHRRLAQLTTSGELRAPYSGYAAANQVSTTPRC